jgi:hypothetical protein
MSLVLTKLVFGVQEWVSKYRMAQWVYWSVRESELGIDGLVENWGEF